MQAPPNAPPIVILPGFGNASRDYEAPFGDPSVSLVAGLERRGFTAYVVPVLRKDWFNVGKMLFTRSYWSDSCTTVPGYSWYLQRVKQTVDAARLNSPGTDQVVLVSHSAGGWLSRAFLGQLDYKDDPLSSTEDDPHEAVSAVVTLGSPHSPPPKDSKFKDMTGGALTWVDSRWPGAYFAPAGVKYIAVGSRAVRGDREADRRTLPGYSYGAYQQVIGRGHDVEGDAVVPLESALLDGAEHVILDDVMHSMSRVRTFDEPAGDGVSWYGSDDVLDYWLKPLVQSDL